MSSDSPDNLTTALRRFAMERDRYVTLLARAAGMSRIEFDALDYIHEAGELTPNQLSQRLLITSGATTALIDRLEAAGRVTRNPHPGDRRSFQLRLTEASDAGGARQLAPYAQGLLNLARELSTEDRVTVARFLERAAAVAVNHADNAQVRAEQRKSAPGSID